MSLKGSLAMIKAGKYWFLPIENLHPSSANKQLKQAIMSEVIEGNVKIDRVSPGDGATFPKTCLLYTSRCV